MNKRGGHQRLFVGIKRCYLSSASQSSLDPPPAFIPQHRRVVVTGNLRNPFVWICGRLLPVQMKRMNKKKNRSGLIGYMYVCV